MFIKKFKIFKKINLQVNYLMKNVTNKKINK